MLTEQEEIKLDQDEEQIYDILAYIAQAETAVVDMLMRQHKPVAERFLEGKDDFSFHQWLCEELDNEYIQQQFGELLKGYVACAMEDLGFARPELIRKIGEIMTGDMPKPEKKQKTAETFQTYYREMARCLLDHRDEK